MRTIDNQYKHADECGSYTVFFGDRTIEVKFVGFLTESLIDKFCDDLGMMLGVIEWQFWGYYGDMTECDDNSDIVRDDLVNLHKRFLKQGCVVSAYKITNPKSIENVNKMKMATGLEYSSINNNLFPDRSQAIGFIHEIILKVKNKSSKLK
jgi:hypothetical protein